MSQTASFLTDFLFPGLLIACGCLGLGVVNGIGNGHRAPRPAAAPIRPAPRTAHYRLNFGEGQTRVTDAERKRLRIYLNAAKLGSRSRITVVAHGVGKRGLRQARLRANGVVSLLRELGVARATIAEPRIVSDDGGASGLAVTILIGKQ